MSSTIDQLIIEKALAKWGLNGAQVRLVAARENKVFHVTAETNRFALRLHRQGYRTDQELWSELKWMEAAASGGLSVPTPVPSASEELLHLVEDVQVDVLTWLSGTTMEDALKEFDTAGRAKLFYSLGKDMALLHDISDSWALPKSFVRCSWDRDGLLGESPLWNRFWDNPSLTSADRKLFLETRARTKTALEEIEYDLDYGLIHADPCECERHG